MALVQKFMVVGTIVPLEERLDVAALREPCTVLDSEMGRPLGL